MRAGFQVPEEGESGNGRKGPKRKGGVILTAKSAENAKLGSRNREGDSGIITTKDSKYAKRERETKAECQSGENQNRGVAWLAKSRHNAEVIYLDHNATTPIAPEVREAMMPYLTDEWGCL
jgi:hypothetical protein